MCISSPINVLLLTIKLPGPSRSVLIGEIQVGLVRDRIKIDGAAQDNSDVAYLSNAFGAQPNVLVRLEFFPSITSPSLGGTICQNTTVDDGLCEFQSC